MPSDRSNQRPRAGYAGLAAAALTLALIVPPHAGGTTAVLTVSATVNANCTMSASPVSFGRYESLLANATAPLNAVGAVSIACTKGSAPKISMDLGRNPNGGRRYMALAAGGASGPADALYYELYQPPSSAPGTACSFPGTMAWGPSGAQTFAPGPPAGRGSRTYSVCGTIPAGQGVSMGSYADTVVATVNF
jgi:spore coat protein U-like protein